MLLTEKEIKFLLSLRELIGDTSKLPQDSIVKSILDLNPLNPNEVRFEEDIVVKLSSGKTFGKYSNGDTIPSKGKTPLEVIKEALFELVSPNLILSTTNDLDSLEVGDNLPIHVVGNFIQNDAGEINTISLRQDGVEVSDSLTASVGMTIPLEATELVMILSYSEGNIPADSITSNVLRIRGRYKNFVGSYSEDIRTSSQVRDNLIPHNDKNNYIDIFIEEGSNSQYVVLHPHCNLIRVEDKTLFNLDITSEYELQGEIILSDASGNPIPDKYKIYRRTHTVPYSSTHVHRLYTKLDEY